MTTNQIVVWYSAAFLSPDEDANATACLGQVAQKEYVRFIAAVPPDWDPECTEFLLKLNSNITDSEFKVLRKIALEATIVHFLIRTEKGVETGGASAGTTVQVDDSRPSDDSAAGHDRKRRKAADTSPGSGSKQPRIDQFFKQSQLTQRDAVAKQIQASEFPYLADMTPLLAQTLEDLEKRGFRLDHLQGSDSEVHFVLAWFLKTGEPACIQ